MKLPTGRSVRNVIDSATTVGERRTAWHLLAASFLDERRPRSVQLDGNFELTREPLRADLLLIRKGQGPVDDAGAFFRLWRLMGPVAIAEYKSRSRPARSGVMSQLLGYGHQYARRRREEIGDVRNLSLFLMVHDLTPALHEDLNWLRLKLGPSEGAYTPVLGTMFPTWIVALNPLSDEEGEPLIGQLGSRTLDEEDVASHQWLAHFVMANREHAKNLEGFEELQAEFRKSALFKKMMAETPVEERLAGVAANDRLRGLDSDEVAEALTPEQRYAVLLAMSDNDLRQLPMSFVESLPESVRGEIHRRLAH